MDRMMLTFVAAVTIALAAKAAVGQDYSSTDGWYEFKPANDNGPCPLGMADWLDKPAGKHGFLTMEGDDLKFADGTAIKLWGVSNCNDGCAPPKNVATANAARYAKYGVNAIRHHKFMESIHAPDTTTQIRPDAWDRFDFYFAECKKQGIYSGWSPIYYQVLTNADKAKLVAGNELGAVQNRTTGLVNFAPDIQDVHITLITNLLKHKNPYTGLAYADDPALAFVEIQNEDDILFYTTEPAVQACPTYKKMLCEQFCDWLKKKYGSEAALLKAWGDKAMNIWDVKDESLERRTIYPSPNPWFESPPGLIQSVERGTTARLLDQVAFLHDAQNAYYAKVAKAIRATGYKGSIVGSCWQAAEGIPHYYNLRSDALVGIVDRHNYFGGRGGWQFLPGPFDAASMCATPGGGMFSSGLQVVKGRPFSLSEWNHVLPNEWGAEGAAIIGAYGLGLQGWDASFQFASDGWQFMPRIDNGRLWPVDTVNRIGLYPAVARMIYRGDVKEAPVLSTRKVAPADLAAGKLGFEDKVQQTGDVKTFGGAVPPEALAIGRCLVEFTEKPEKTDPVDLSKYIKDKVAASMTGQLVWNYSGKGFFTIDTPGTKAVVGFAGGKECNLGDVTITVDTPYAVLFVTAAEKGKTLKDSKAILVTAIARIRNTGMRFNAAGTSLEAVGREPVLVEPVKATIAIAGRKISTVKLLDHDGRETAGTLPVDGGKFTINGAVDKTMYYQVVAN